MAESVQIRIMSVDEETIFSPNEKRWLNEHVGKIVPATASEVDGDKFYEVPGFGRIWDVGPIGVRLEYPRPLRFDPEYNHWEG